MKYKKNYLKSVIFRVDFPLILELVKDIPSEFQKKIDSEFPILEDKSLTEVTIDFKGKDRIKNESLSSIWFFFNKERSRKIELSKNFLSIEFYKYTYFPEFYSVVESIYQFFLSIYNPAIINRLGHRYINNIIIKEGDAFDWGGYINNELTYVIDKFDHDKSKLSRVINQMIYNYDDYKMSFYYGLYNSIYPSVIAKKEFLLDFDCFLNEIDPSKVLSYMKNFNSSVNKIFEACISDKLRNLMEPIKDIK